MPYLVHQDVSVDGGMMAEHSPNEIIEGDVKLGRKTLPIDHEVVRAEVARVLAYRSTVMLHEDHRIGRRHHKLHRNRQGVYIRLGRNGSKMYLVECHVTYFDGKPGLFQFRRAPHQFEIVHTQREAAELERWEKEHGY